MGEMACIAEVAFTKLEMTAWPCSPWSGPVYWRDAIGDDQCVEEGTDFAIETA